MVDYVSRYQNYLVQIKHASDNTVVSYIRDVRQFASYLVERSFSVSNVTRAEITQYVSFLQLRGKSQATIARNLASLKGFISGLHAGNFDITHIFIDSFYKLVENGTYLSLAEKYSLDTSALCLLAD